MPDPEDEAIDKKRMLARMVAQRRDAYRERLTAIRTGQEATNDSTSRSERDYGAGLIRAAQEKERKEREEEYERRNRGGRSRYATREMREMTLADRQRMGEEENDIRLQKAQQEAEDRIPLQHAFQHASSLKREGWVRPGCTRHLIGLANLLASTNLFASAGGGVKRELTRITTLLQRWDDRLVVLEEGPGRHQLHGPEEVFVDPEDPVHKEWRNLLTNELTKGADDDPIVLAENLIQVALKVVDLRQRRVIPPPGLSPEDFQAALQHAESLGMALVRANSAQRQQLRRASTAAAGAAALDSTPA